MEGYLILASSLADPAPIPAWIRAAIADRPDLEIGIDEAGLLVVATPGLTPAKMAREGKWVLGDIFQRGTSDRAHFKSGTATSARMRAPSAEWLIPRRFHARIVLERGRVHVHRRRVRARRARAG